MQAPGVTTKVQTQNFLAAGLAGNITAPAAAKLGLGTGSIVPSPDRVWGDVAPNTIAGGAAKNVVPGPVSYDPATQVAEAVGTAVYQWFGPADATGQTVTYWYLYQPAVVGPPAVPEILLACGLLPVPVLLLNPTQTLALAAYFDSRGGISCETIP